ncbi:hypothetical protein D3C71_1271430 [compost metagenome]
MQLSKQRLGFVYRALHHVGLVAIGTDVRIRLDEGHPPNRALATLISNIKSSLTF